MPLPVLPLIFRNVQYHPNQKSVAILAEHPLGSFFVNLEQPELATAAAGFGGRWSDEEILALGSVEANRIGAEQGVAFDCRFPDPEPDPAPSIDEPPAP